MISFPKGGFRGISEYGVAHQIPPLGADAPSTLLLKLFPKACNPTLLKGGGLDHPPVQENDSYLPIEPLSSLLTPQTQSDQTMAVPPGHPQAPSPDLHNR